MTGFENTKRFTVKGERGKGLPIALDLIGQSAQASIEAMLTSENEEVVEKGQEILSQLDSRYGGLEGLITNPSAIHNLSKILHIAEEFDPNLSIYADTLSTAIADANTSDEEYSARIDMNRNSERPEPEWTSRKSNVDGNQYMVHNETGEYLSQEDYEATNAYTAPDSMGWDGDTEQEAGGLIDK